MESLVRLSFYFFAAATIALVTSAACYLVYAVGRIRLRHTALTTSAGTTVVSHGASLEPASLGIGRFATLLAWFGVAFQGISILLRTIAAGRLPLSNMYEFSSTFILLAGLVYLVFERWYGVRQLGAIVLPLIVAMATYVWLLPSDLREVDALIPALQNRPLMTIHVSMAILAYATFAVAFAAAVLFLIANRWRVTWLPGPDLLDDLAFRAVTIGFPALSLVLILGSVWAYRAWGTYWQWDPKETSALFTWLIYGVYLHTRSLRGWRGNRSAAILLVAFAAVVFTYFGNYIFGGLHAYGGV
ncbi:MAG: c-type cytochrome biogenesis protein CcsB [Chloroflexota bacterium]|nr:c-type cytochrome biogenesis protein CcsB [Chloroflexia bacterium]MDQ3226726.1 c-type cytochrome biogenesis protein CcsB [Chloroflexota bacterium]